MKKLLYLSAIILLVQSCSKQKTVPKDFGFRIEEPNFVINSFDSTYTRRFQDKDSVVKLIFTNEELSQIFMEFTNNNLDDLPADFKPNCKIYSMPTFETIMKIQMNKKIIQIEYRDDCKDDFFKFVTKARIKRIEKSLEKVILIVDSKKEIENMPESNIIYK